MAVSGPYLLSCGTEVKLHTVPAYETAHVYRPADGTAGTVRSVSWCKDGSWVSVVPFQGNVEIVRARDDLRLLQSVLGVAQPTAAAFQRTTKRHVAIGTAAGAVLVYDLRARDVRKTFYAGGVAETCSGSGDGAVTLLDWSTRDAQLAAAGAGGRVSLYSNSTNQRTGVLTVPASRSVSALRFSPLQRLLLGLASDEGAVVVYDVHAGKARLSVQPHRAPVTDLAFSRHNNSLLATCALDRTCLFYDTSQAEVAVTLSVDQPLSALDLADGGTLALGSTRGHVYIYDLRNYSAPLKTFRAHNTEVRRLLYQPCAPEHSVADSADTSEPRSEQYVEVQLEPRGSRVSSVGSFTQLLNSVNEFAPRLDHADAGTDAASFLAELGRIIPDCRFPGSGHDCAESSRHWPDGKASAEEPAAGAAVGDAQAEALLKAHSSKISLSGQRTTSRLQLRHEQECAGADAPQQPSSPHPSAPVPSSDELVRLVQDVVTRVVSDQIADLVDTLNRHFLNLQLSFSKQFVCQEEQIEKLAQHASSGLVPGLMGQVERLRQENQRLKDEISDLVHKPGL